MKNQEKMSYIAPEIKIVLFASEDIITSSGEENETLRVEF